MKVREKYHRWKRGMAYEPEERILRALEEARRQSVRDYLVLALGYYCGLRAGEIVSLRVEDINFDDRKIRVKVEKKKKKEEAIQYRPFPSKLIPALREQVAGRREGWLFPAYRGKGHMHRTTVWRIVLRYSDELYPHKLRHSIAVKMLKEGVDLRTIQRFLAHSDISTTARYLQLHDEDVEKRYREIFDPADEAN